MTKQYCLDRKCNNEVQLVNGYRIYEHYGMCEPCATKWDRMTTEEKVDELVAILHGD